MPDIDLQANKKTRLGRGLGSLLSSHEVLSEVPVEAPKETVPASSQESRVLMVPIEKLYPNPKQPRKHFNEEDLKMLAHSIKERGVLQPLLVRQKAQGSFEILAGERRWRACQIAGLRLAPVLVITADDQNALEIGIIENIQRRDLNPVEEALAYQRLIDDFELTQESVSERVGKDRATIANLLRVLVLPIDVREMLACGEISIGHAKLLLSLSNASLVGKIAGRIRDEKLTIKALESLIKKANQTGAPKAFDVDLSEKLALGLAEQLQKVMGTKVQIEYKKGAGKLSVYFYSDDELTELVEKAKETWRKA